MRINSNTRKASDAFGLLLASTLVACLYTGCAREAGDAPPPEERSAATVNEVRGAAIDGSEDELPVLPAAEDLPAPVVTPAVPQEIVSVAEPNFEAIDEANPGLRPQSIDDIIQLQEDRDVRDVERDGKPFKSVNFGLLAGYKYRAPGRGELTKEMTELPKVLQGQIPQDVSTLSNEQIAIRGFMIPLEMAKGRITSFVLVRNQMMCCFDQVPEMNEWIHVKVLDGAGVPFMQDRPLTVYGRFEVGEIVKNGQLISIYRMDAIAVDT